MIADDRLRLIFTCCHPALAREAQVALTLRLVCGLTTAEIALAFVVSEPTMAARVTRAKKKISAARIAYRVPDDAELPDRLDAVLTVVHLLYTTGHTDPPGADLVRADLVERAIDLARMLRALMPDEREVRGLLALLLLTDARRATRTDDDGRPAAARGPGPVAVGPRGDRGRRRAGDRGAARRPARQVRAAGSDRGGARRGAELRRDRLAAAAPALRRGCCAPGRRRWSRSTGPWCWPWSTGQRRRWPRSTELEQDGRLAGYRYLPAAKADLLRRLDRPAMRPAAYRSALDLADNAAERAFLAGRIAEVCGGAG